MKTRTKIYEFKVYTQKNIFVFGKGTLKEGADLITKMDKELETRYLEWYKPDKIRNTVLDLLRDQDEPYFTLPKPYDKVPMGMFEGGDITAELNGKVEYVEAGTIDGEPDPTAIEGRWA